MTNLLGPKLTLTRSTFTLVITERQFVGEDGYVRTIKEFPTLDRSSNGFANYRQPGTAVPAHQIRIKVILSKDEAINLVNLADFMTLEYKTNNQRNVEPITLIDEKLAIPQSAMPVGDTWTEIGTSGWGFPTIRTIITNINYQVRGPQKYYVELTLDQLI